jgi:hypothetical protein
MLRLLQFSLLVAMLPSTFAQFAGYSNVDPSIVDYLKLTPQQTNQIEALRASSATETAARSRQIAAIAARIAAEQEKEVPEAGELGQLYVESILLSRANTASSTKLANDTRALLTPAQSALLVPLKEAQRLRSLANRMECEGFLDPLPLLNGVLIPSIGFSGFVNGCSTRFLLLPTQAQAAAASAWISPEDPLSAYLALTGEQVVQISQLQRDFDDYRSEKILRTSQVERELDQEANQPLPDAIAIGLRLVELETIKREVEHEQAVLVKTIQSKLSSEQLIRLRAIEDARRLAALDPVAQSQGFVLPEAKASAAGVPED